MLRVDVTKVFSSFTVAAVQKAKEFYGQTLGLEISETYGGQLLEIHIAGGSNIVVIIRFIMYK